MAGTCQERIERDPVQVGGGFLHPADPVPPLKHAHEGLLARLRLTGLTVFDVHGLRRFAPSICTPDLGLTAGPLTS